MKLKINLIVGIILTIIVFLCFYLIRKHSKDVDTVNPELYMNNKLKSADRLRLKIHSTHHTNEDIEKLVKELEKGKSWSKTHKILKPVSFIHHLKHIDIEIMRLFLNSLTITIGLLTYYFIREHIIEIYSPKNPIIAVWYWAVSICIIIILFSVFIMKIKHYLSFKSFDEKLFY